MILFRLFLFTVYTSVCFVLQYFVVCARKRLRGTYPHFDVPVLPYPWVDALALTRWLLLLPRRAGYVAVQLPAPASNLAVPPPAASTAAAVNLSVGVAIIDLSLIHI